MLPRNSAQFSARFSDGASVASTGLDTRYTRYHLSGFLTLQQLVDEYAWELAANASANMSAAPRPPTAALAGLPFPTAAYEQNVFYQASGYGCSNARRRTRKCLRKCCRPSCR